MDITTATMTAALRSGSESFMVPTGADAWRHLADSRRSDNAFGVVTGTGYDVATGIGSATVLSAGNRPMVARDGRSTAKQTGPPRGVPR